MGLKFINYVIKSAQSNKTNKATKTNTIEPLKKKTNTI